jgi:excisionase family DNA binding protein
MEVYTVQEVADKLKVEYKTVLRLIERRVLITLPGIRHKRIPASELVRYLDVRSTLAASTVQNPPTSKSISVFGPATSAEHPKTVGKEKKQCKSK